MTFWQSFAINILSGLGFVDESSAKSTQNLLICIEMLIASITHVYIFPYEEWSENWKKEKEHNIVLRDTLILKDFITDLNSLIYKKVFTHNKMNLHHNDVDNDVEVDGKHADEGEGEAAETEPEHEDRAGDLTRLSE